MRLSMVDITSSNNDRVRRVQALQRSTRRRMREGLMVVEGLRLVGELIESDFPVIDLFFTEEFVGDAEGSALIERVEQRDRCAEVTPDIMREMSDTMTPQGVLAVTTVPNLSPQSHRPPSSGAPLILIPDQVRDPGNLGTMLRTAWAADVGRVMIPPGTVDPTNPKVVRAGMGAHFHLPCQKLDWASIWRTVGDAQILLAEAEEGPSYDEVDWQQSTALVIGGEAFGAGSETRARAKAIHIPMAEGVESLNAAVAAAILMFESARQRGVGRVSS